MKKSTQSIYFIVALVIIGLLLFFWLPTIGNIVTDTPVTPMPKDEFSENAELEIQNTPDDFQTIAFDKKSVKSLLQSYRTPESFVWLTTFCIDDGSGAKYSYGAYYKDGNSEKIEQYSTPGALTWVYTMTPERVTIRDVVGGRSTDVLRTSQYDAMTLLHMPNMKYFYLADDSSITQAAFDELDGERVLYVEYYYPTLRQTEKYWISLDYGVPLLAESYIGSRRYMYTSTRSITKS